MLQYTAVIVEDELSARRLLNELLIKHQPVIRIIGETDSGIKAIGLINTLKPNVIFLDIQLQDSLGFDVLRGLNYQPFVIFTTAYDEYAIKAFDSLSVDYLLKPLKEGQLLRAINKLQRFSHGRNKSLGWKTFESLGNDLRKNHQIKTLSVKKGSKFTLVQLSDILYLEAYDKYSFVHTTHNQKLFCDHMLSVLEEKLSADFVRVQKSYIVNKEKIHEIYKYSNNRFTIVLKNKDLTQIVSGPSYFNIIKEVFEV